MTKRTFQISCLILTGTIIIATSFAHFSVAADVKRIAVLPFKINSEKDLSFLRDGIFDMLSTRLAEEGQVEVISRAKVDEALQTGAKSGTINEAIAHGIGTELNADYVVFGSLTVLGQNVSIDTKVVDISGAKPTMTFFDQSNDLGAVITKINLMAAEINNKVLGRQTSTTQAATTTPEPSSQPAEKPNIHAHPESVLKKDGFIDQAKRETSDSAEIIPGTTRETDAQFWKSANFKFLINGVSLGDVDGDGKIETVVISPHSVIIFRYLNGAFSKVIEIDEGSNHNLTAIDVADVNNNGYAELFVTSLNAKKNILNSYVLEFNGKTYGKTVDDSYWIYRVADTANRGKVLLGQRPRFGESFSGAIYEMKWQSGEYIPTDEIKTPRHTNLLGLTIGDIVSDDGESTVAYRENDYFRIIDPSGNPSWQSPERYGGSMLYYAAPLEDRGQIENKKYFPMRLLIWHSPTAEGSEVIAVKNHDLTDRKMEYRKLTKTHIEAFTWDGVGLRPSWKTRTMSGYIPDYYIGDFDNDGRDELIAALVLETGEVAFISDPKSTLIALELSPARKQ